MPDVHSHITTAEPALVRFSSTPWNCAPRIPSSVIRERFLSEVAFPAARVLEAGCGSGAICRELASWSQAGGARHHPGQLRHQPEGVRFRAAEGGQFHPAPTVASGEPARTLARADEQIIRPTEPLAIAIERDANRGQ